MTDIPSLLSRARLEMSDNPETFTSQFQGDDFAKIITLPRRPVLATSISAQLVSTISGITTPLNQGTDYTMDERQGTLTLVTDVPSGSVLTVSGTNYRYFTDADWTTFITTAIADHLHNRQDVQDISFLPVEEIYPLTILAVIQALYCLLTDASFDINISTPEGVAIPRAQRFEQLQSMLANRLDQYNRWCMAFNVGMFRIEMFDLRRVSRTTNRLVPIYTPQEFVDTRFPTEQFPPIDPHGNRLVPTPVLQQVINLTGYSNQPFSYTITGLGNLTGLTVKASVRRYPQGYTPLAVFTVVVNDYANGVVTISLDGTLAYYLGTSKFWDLQTVSASGSVSTLVGGTMDFIRQGTFG